VPEEFEPCEILHRINAAPLKENEAFTPALSDMIGLADQPAEKIAIP
jgi:hypothetical protein